MRLSKNLKSTLMISSLVLTAVACTNSKVAKHSAAQSQTDSKTQSTSSETTVINGIETKKLSYQFKENDCDTDRHEFASLQELCNGLQDEKLNNFCTPEAREEKFKHNCSGTYTPFVSDSFNTDALNQQMPAPKSIGKPAEDVAPKAGAQADSSTKEMKSGDAGFEVFKMSPPGVDVSQASAFSILSCGLSPREIIENKRNGILLLPESKMILARDNDYKFADGSSTANLSPFVKVNCNSQAGQKPADITTLDPKLFQVRELHTGNALLDVMITSPEGKDDRQSGMITVSCDSDISSATIKTRNGIDLMKGATLVIARDLNFKFSDGTSTAGHEPYVIVTCK